MAPLPRTALIFLALHPSLFHTQPVVSDLVAPPGAFNRPQSVAFLEGSSLLALIADTMSHRVLAFELTNTSNTITPFTLAGGGNSGNASGSADGAGTAALFNHPSALEPAAAAGAFFVADAYNSRVCVLTVATREVTTLAGGGASGTEPGSVNGRGTAALFHRPYGLARCPAGLPSPCAAGGLFVADTYNHLIRFVAPNGDVSTVAGGGRGDTDGVGTAAQFNGPQSLTLDAEGGLLYLSDKNNYRVKVISLPSLAVSVVAGAGMPGFKNGVGRDAVFGTIFGLALGEGGVLVMDGRNSNIRLILLPSTQVTTMIGGGASETSSGTADGAGTNALFSAPQGCALDPWARLLVADTDNSRMRLVVGVSGGGGGNNSGAGGGLGKAAIAGIVLGVLALLAAAGAAAKRWRGRGRGAGARTAPAPAPERSESRTRDAATDTQIEFTIPLLAPLTETSISTETSSANRNRLETEAYPSLGSLQGSLQCDESVSTQTPELRARLWRKEVLELETTALQEGDSFVLRG